MGINQYLFITFFILTGLPVHIRTRQEPAAEKPSVKLFLAISFVKKSGQYKWDLPGTGRDVGSLRQEK